VTPEETKSYKFGKKLAGKLSDRSDAELAAFFAGLQEGLAELRAEEGENFKPMKYFLDLPRRFFEKLKTRAAKASEA
jgi:hypothetical protein